VTSSAAKWNGPDASPTRLSESPRSHARPSHITTGGGACEVRCYLRVRSGLAEGASYHDCRHTYASVLLSGGVSVAAVADYIGHSPAVLLKT
jgi:integrase